MNSNQISASYCRTNSSIRSASPCSMSVKGRPMSAMDLYRGSSALASIEVKRVISLQFCGSSKSEWGVVCTPCHITCCVPDCQVFHCVHAFAGASCFPCPAKCFVYDKDTCCLQLKTVNQNMTQDTVMSCLRLQKAGLLLHVVDHMLDRLQWSCAASCAQLAAGLRECWHARYNVLTCLIASQCTGHKVTSRLVQDVGLPCEEEANMQ